MITPRLLWKMGAAFAAFGMLTGAFGAHGLKKLPNITADQIHAFETASSYAIYNGLGLLALSMHPRFSTHKFAGPAIAGGTLIFSGSIMTLVLVRDRFRFLGPITPLGGMAMIAGYLSLLF
ncbi:hypothetical protein CONPUDRAFT_78915 [Coniophora puteana RWD-64-598 SS2]|uniref:DUF423-domain-containing protein n=1 Tax=Coniophora puteana (strain RWD-64-598) TaxID=741705 RepID=A0A5M3N5D5_CONPW|nr:uncharacterized protein CONPUDRAFT_78915 [Coniophora puteana RWD-64-598 SS2]EIW86619.1 hypothetical protein CONPUDRAFT_78915 [Coniophora puteana RWD-64-598 SS2]